MLPVTCGTTTISKINQENFQITAPKERTATSGSIRLSGTRSTNRTALAQSKPQERGTARLS
uniref:Uncharacterized protein n=1 Tax=Arundo donax TaxID=35708 RepID=A0A0A8YCU9_ARUDO